MNSAVRLLQRDIAVLRNVLLFYRTLHTVNNTDLTGQAPRGVKNIHNHNSCESFMAVNCIQMSYQSR